MRSGATCSGTAWYRSSNRARATATSKVNTFSRMITAGLASAQVNESGRRALVGGSSGKGPRHSAQGGSGGGQAPPTKTSPVRSCRRTLSPGGPKPLLDLPFRSGRLKESPASCPTLRGSVVPGFRNLQLFFTTSVNVADRSFFKDSCKVCKSTENGRARAARAGD